MTIMYKLWKTTLVRVSKFKRSKINLEYKVQIYGNLLKPSESATFVGALTFKCLSTAEIIFLSSYCYV